MLNQVTLDVALTVEGPMLTKSSAPGGYGVDALMSVNSKGQYYIPGSLVKGKFREACCDLSEATAGDFLDDPDRWLGGRSENRKGKTTGVDPDRGCILFSDFLHDGPGRQGLLHRIKIDDALGSVASGALQVIESPFAPGERICFRGQISYVVTDEKAADDLARKIETGLRWIVSLGAFRTVGFGRLVNVAVTRTSARAVAPLRSLSDKTEHITMVITPLAPFCISRRRVSHNLFESESVIPGGVIRGAIASAWGAMTGKGLAPEIDDKFDPARPELCKHFGAIRFRHAFPARLEELKRPITPPLSLVKIEKKGYYDIALCKEPILINGKAPEFAVDWKDCSDVDADFRWSEPDRELRVRTAMDEEFRRAKDEQLFAYEMVVPDGRSWRSVIDLDQVPGNVREKVTEQFQGLLAHGLNGWGKTKVSADIQLTDYEPIETDVKPIDGRYIVTLQTPAILCDPEQLEHGKGKILRDSYEEAWTQLSNGALRLECYFASQSLAGGEYLWRRFQGGPDEPYRPYLLTNEGSVFVLEVVKETEAAECISKWMKQGLPLPAWACDAYSKDGKSGDHWTNCPYLPLNGYGEVAVNLSVHWEKKVKEGC